MHDRTRTARRLDRRSVLRLSAAGGIAVLLTSCGSGGEADDSGSIAPPGPGGGTRTVTHALGTVEVPVEPRRPVALDEYSAMTAYSLDVRPVEVFGTFRSAASARVLGDAGIPVVPSGLEQLPPTETIAALAPDVIVASGGGPITKEVYDALNRVAPVVVLPYYGATWQETVRATGAAFGRADRAAAVIAGLEQRIAAIGANPGNRRTLSLLGDASGQLFAPARGTPLSSVLRAAGFDRPAAQDVDASLGGGMQVLPLSPEGLSAHDGDLIVLFTGSGYDADAVRAVPTFQALPAARQGRVVEVEGDLWFGTFPFAIHWLITDLTAIAEGAGPDRIGRVPDDVAQRWATFHRTTPG